MKTNDEKMERLVIETAKVVHRMGQKLGAETYPLGKAISDVGGWDEPKRCPGCGGELDRNEQTGGIVCHKCGLEYDDGTDQR